MCVCLLQKLKMFTVENLGNTDIHSNGKYSHNLETTIFVCVRTYAYPLVFHNVNIHTCYSAANTCYLSKKRKDDPDAELRGTGN